MRASTYQWIGFGMTDLRINRQPWRKIAQYDSLWDILQLYSRSYAGTKEIEMDYFKIMLRIVHILAGVIWVGGALIMTFFVSPTVAATAEAGQRFVGYMMNNLKFSQRISAAAGLSVLAGAILYWNDSSGFTSAWMKSGAGIGFTIGAVFALIGFGFGIVLARTIKSMSQLGAQVQGKPTAEQAAPLQSLQKQQVLYSRINVATLILAVIFMAIARYLVF